MNKSGSVAIAPLLVSIPDAAKALGIGRSSIYKLMKEQKLESVPVRGRRMIPEAAIRDYVSALRAGQRTTSSTNTVDDADFFDFPE